MLGGDRVLGVRDGLSPGRTSRGRVAVLASVLPGQLLVEPSVELMAFWELIDAQYGDPVPVAVFGEPVVDALDDFALVELIVQLAPEASLARARQLVVVQALSRRASMNPFWPVRVGEPNITAEEVAAALGSCRAVGRDLVHTARLFAGALLATAAALEAGDIDWGKAKIFAAVLGDVAIQVALDVQARVLPGAGRRTHAQLRRDLARALIVVDPHDAEHQVVRATDKRRVCHPQVLPDGMAGIWAAGPGAVAGQIDTALDTAARTARSAGDPRTPDQLRADTLTAALTSALGTCGAGTLPHRDPPHRDGQPGSFGVTSLAAAGAPAAGSPNPGSPNSGFPNAGASKAGSPNAGSARVGAARAGSCGARCSGVRVDVTVSLATLLGVDQAPGEQAGYGPITAQTARRLAATGTWRRLITDPATDPATGTFLDVGKTRYRPPVDLAEIGSLCRRVAALACCRVAAQSHRRAPMSCRGAVVLSHGGGVVLVVRWGRLRGGVGRCARSTGRSWWWWSRCR